MTGENGTAANAAPTESPPQETAPRARQRSTIGFPYMDLAAAIELAVAIHGNVGVGECDDDQLAAWSKQSAKSSTFRVQVYAARTFGILEGESSRHKLSAIGQAIVDPKRVRQAKADAFLTVPLFKAIFEKYKGGVLPPAAALERDIASLGVAEKQKGRARQTLERSAEQAGFFEHGKTRLVLPGFAARGMEGIAGESREDGNGEAKPPPPPPPPPQGPTYHPFIQGLLKTLPDPEKEKDWPVAQRIKWLQTAANIFDLIFDGDGGIEVRAATAHRSPRPE